MLIIKTSKEDVNIQAVSPELSTGAIEAASCANAKGIIISHIMNDRPEIFNLAIIFSQKLATVMKYCNAIFLKSVAILQ